MEKKKKFDEKKYNQEYLKKNYQNISFRLRNEEDKDVIDKLASVENKTAYLVSLVRADLEDRIL